MVANPLNQEYEYGIPRERIERKKIRHRSFHFVHENAQQTQRKNKLKKRKNVYYPTRKELSELKDGILGHRKMYC